MEIVYYLCAFCLISFIVLAIYDGIYLHLWKYELHGKDESRFEHLTHTIRAILFPLILIFLFICSNTFCFFIGIFLFLVDLIVLGIDAYSEKDSRQFMGGLPRCEYIIHLFANSFHFASIVLFISTRLKIEAFQILIVNDYAELWSAHFVYLIALNLIPGAVLLAIIHLILMTKNGAEFWTRLKIQIQK